MAVAEASFNTVKLSMSLGLIISKDVTHTIGGVIVDRQTINDIQWVVGCAEREHHHGYESGHLHQEYHQQSGTSTPAILPTNMS